MNLNASDTPQTPHQNTYTNQRRQKGANCAANRLINGSNGSLEHGGIKGTGKRLMETFMKLWDMANMMKIRRQKA